MAARTLRKAAIRKAPSEAARGEEGGSAARRPAPAFHLESFLPYRLSVAANRVSRAFARRYAEEFGLSIPEWRVLAVLGSFAPLSSNEVCELTAMDKAKVSRAVSLLNGKGYVRRLPNPEDQRLLSLSFTAKGRAVYEAIVPLARAMESELVASLAPGERQTLDRLLRRLEAAAG